jgi:hypothetical protein
VRDVARAVAGRGQLVDAADDRRLILIDAALGVALGNPQVVVTEDLAAGLLNDWYLSC